MKLMTREEFQVIEDKFPYHAGRWDYHDFAINILKTKEFNSALELGPGPCSVSIIHEAHTMKTGGATYEGDARILPWPIKDKQYDLFLCLQTFEHLGPDQQDIFAEVIRISNSALISFPHNWDYKDHDLTLETMHDWTGRQAVEVHYQGNPKHKRNAKVFMYFDFTEEK